MTESINRYLDHAVLKPEMTREEAIQWILTGIEYKVKTVCVRPCDIDMAVAMCKGTETGVSCVLGFPHGDACTESKVEEAKLYCSKGVDEIDMVANYGWIRSGLWNDVYSDIKSVVDMAHHKDGTVDRFNARNSKILVKVIFETSRLTVSDIIRATEICVEAGADFVKTSTGFNGEGATETVVECMLKTAAGKIKVKPSGGIRDADRARMFIDMGVARLGVNCTSTPAICGGKVPSENTGY